MKKAMLIFILILFCILLSGCESLVTDSMGERFKLIEQDAHITLCYDANTMAVYIVYRNLYQYGISPYIMFDEFDEPTIGQWNGKEIIPAKKYGRNKKDKQIRDILENGFAESLPEGLQEVP